MMPRKKRIAIIAISIILIISIIIGILAYLYIKTDAFKSNETLFAKYLVQNIEMIDICSNEKNQEIENTLNTNKYISNINGQIEYIENIGTSNENKDSNINNVGIKINSNIDKNNNYNYKEISIGTEDEDLVKLEYLKENEIHGIRPNGIKQFVSAENSQENEILKELGIENIEALENKIDINSIFSFTEEEKQTLANNYLSIIQNNVSKDRYYKQPNSIITINNQEVQTNAYYIKLTIEEYNNLYIQILQQITNDEIILSKIDLIESEIKENISNYEQDETLRQNVINTLNSKIEEIQNNNIGSEEVKIIVYENNMKTVRTSIEKSTNTINIDLYNDSSIKIENTQLGENIEQEFIKIEKDINQTQSNIFIEFKKIKDNEIIKDIQLNYQQQLENNEITKQIELEIQNENYKGILNIQDNIEIVQEFENQITLNEDNIMLDELEEEKREIIKNKLSENMQTQIANLNTKVSEDDYTEMLKKLDIIEDNSIEMPGEGGVTDIERRRFNSQFEFFVSENLTADNIKELIKATEDNFGTMKVLFESGEIADLDMEKIIENNRDAKEYKESISEILIGIKQNSQNTEKQEDTLEFIENNKNSKYTVSMEYDDNGLVSIIRVKIQKD